MQTVRYRRELYKLLPLISEAHVAELGTAEGYFAAEMAGWGIKKLYVVDMWESNAAFPGDAGNDQEWHNKNYSDAMARLQKFGDAIEVLRGPTIKMAAMVPDNSLDLVNVDACHAYDCVKNDIDAWWPKLKSGGIMAFHDYEMRHYGVKQAVTEFAHRYNLEIHLLPEDKPEDAGAYLVKK